MSTQVIDREKLRERARQLQIKGDKRAVEVYSEELRSAMREEARDAAKIIVSGLQGTGVRALKRLDDLIDSEDERVATSNVHFAINHVIGMPTQKSVVQRTNINIDLVAD